MTLKQLLETVLLSQYVTIKNVATDRLIVHNLKYGEIPYTTIAEFLECPVMTVESQIVDTKFLKNIPLLYIEVDYYILESI